jgi:hypothetical protein
VETYASALEKTPSGPVSTEGRKNFLRRNDISTGTWWLRTHSERLPERANEERPLEAELERVPMPALHRLGKPVRVCKETPTRSSR